MHGRALTCLAVSIVLLAPVLGLTSLLIDLDAPSGDSTDYEKTTITYHRDIDGLDSVLKDYDGIASAEYSPEQLGKDWTGEKSTIEVPVKLHFSHFGDIVETFQFTTKGTIDNLSNVTIEGASLDGDLSAPDENGTYTFMVRGTYVWWSSNYRYDFTIGATFLYEFNKVFSGWSNEKGSTYFPGDIIDTDDTELYAEWIDPVLWLNGLDSNGELTVRGTTTSFNPVSEVPYEGRGDYARCNDVESSVFNTVYTFGNETTLGGRWYSPVLDVGTYRSEAGKHVSVSIYKSLKLSGDVIIDDVSLDSENSVDGKHGDGSGGIYACGNMLILGPDVTAPERIPTERYVQIIGGYDGGSGSGSTDVSIFGGIYYNVVAGSQGGVWSGDTHLVMRGGVVLDTVVGGDGGSGTSGDGTTRSTHVYMLGEVWMPGDYHEEFNLDNEERFSDLGILPIEESTILTGGSNNGSITGDTYVYVSNGAELWDVQAGGRRSSSVVEGTAYAEVSGSGLIKHILCGSITDGIDGVYTLKNDVQSVKDTNLSVTENARVGSIFGAGYDTYYSAKFPSMWGPESTITVLMDGGTVGFIYGGGYRGTIGTPDEPIGSISIDISGGTVLGDVFGGGRGGLDKVLHYVDGSIGSSSMGDSTGYSQVFADQISIDISGGTVQGDVFGGGESVPVLSSYNGWTGFGSGNFTDPETDSGVASVESRSISVSVRGGEVLGSIHGAGKGVDKEDLDGYHSSASIFAITKDGVEEIPWYGDSGSTDVSEVEEYSNYASTTGSVSVYIGNGAKVQGNVFGGGQYGRTGPEYGVGDSISVDLGEAHIGGSVFAGGYGCLNELSTNSATRTVSIDGAEIGGSVYGGSSYGNDNCHDQGNITDCSKGSAEIRVLSGDISSGSSGNVYGGSYRGYSYMDTEILIGVPALGGGQPASDHLSIHSVYGGASVGESSDSRYDSDLLMGSTSVLIGNMHEDGTSAYGSFSIKGDVFGEGDYCGITGTSEVTFRGFAQGSALLSVQKTDSLVVEGSKLDLEGNVDGSTPDASERLSLNLIGDLVLKKHGVWGASNLNLRSAASQIGGYGSLEEDGTTGNVPDFSGEVQMNSIVLHRGMLMSILGTGNSGDVGSQIRGYTLIDNGSSTYYGTFVMGVTDHVLSDSTGFFVKRGDEYRATQEAHYEYTLGGSELIGITMWYISGVYKVESTLVLEDSGSGPSVSASDEVMAPKTVKGSDILYVGGYVYADSPGSLELVDGLGTDHDEFVLNLGKSGDGRLNLGRDGIDVTFPANGSSKFEGSGVRIGFSISTLPNFTSTGYAGTVVLHMVEMHGGILVNSFDIEMGVYLRTAETNGTIEGTIVMRTSGTSSGTTRKYSGSTDIYLPALSGNDMADYHTSLGNYVDGGWQAGSVPSGGSLSLQTVSTNLNKNGWQSSEYPDVSGEVTSSGIKGMYLGVGGVYSPVVRFHYDLLLEGDADPGHITLTVWVDEQVSGIARACYTVVLKPVIATELGLSFHDKDLIENGGELDWSGSSLIFTIPVEFGKDVSDLYVAVSDGFIEGGINVPIDSDYRTEVHNGIDGILLYEGGSVVLGSLDEVKGRIADKAFTPKKITEFLQSYVDHKPDTEYGEGMRFDYSAYPRWYDTKDCLTLFNFETPITADTEVFAGYGIEITIRPFTDLDNIQGSGAGISVVPSEVLVRLPGSEVDLNDLYEGLSISPGYSKVTPNEDHGVWYTVGSDGPVRLDRFGESSCIFTPRADSDVYLFLEKAQYSIELHVKGGSGDEYDEYKIDDPTNPFTMTVDGNSTGVAKAVYGSEVVITFTYSGEGYRIGKVTGQTAHGIHGVGHTSDGTGHTLSFKMADGDLEIYVDMTDKRTVTVTLPEGKADNDRFSVSLGEVDGRLCIDIHDTAQGSGNHTALIQTGSEDAYLLDRNTAFGSGSFLITAYAGDGRLVCEPENGLIGSLVLSKLGDDVEIEIYVQIKWTLSISGDGYGVMRYAVSDPTKPGDYSSGTIYNATDGSSYVLTGDSLGAESTDPERALKSLGTSGLNRTGVDFAYRVAGSGNPSMFNPVHGFTVTVEVTFESGGSTVVPGEWSEGTELTLSGKGSMVQLNGSSSGDAMVFTGACETGEYRIEASCPGFVSVSMTKQIDGLETIEIALDAIGYTITVSSPVDSKTCDVSWNVTSSGGFEEIIKGVVGSVSDADMWFRSSGAGYVLLSGDAPTPEMFDSGNALSLLGVPSLDGTDPTSDPVPRIVVVVSEGPVNGTHSVGPVEGVKNVTLTGTVNGTEVTIGYSVDGTGASLTIAGFPDGTGAWVVNGNTLSVLIVVVPDLEGRT